MKKSILKGLLIILICLTLFGCGKSKTKNPLVGKWAHENFVYTFNEDNTFTYNAAGTIMKGKYKIDNNNKLSILYEGDDISLDITFSIEKNKLNIKDSFGEDTTYEKQ